MFEGKWFNILVTPLSGISNTLNKLTVLCNRFMIFFYWMKQTFLRWVSFSSFQSINTVFLVSHTAMFRTIKSSRRLLSSRTTCNSSFQTERVHGSAFSDQTKCYKIFIPYQKCIVLLSSIIARNLSVELCYCLYKAYCRSTSWSVHHDFAFE